MINNTQLKADALARKILLLVRDTLLVKLRFMDSALCELALMPAPVALATDARNLFYDAHHILREYKREKESAVRDYLHVVLHCVFRHLFVAPQIDTLRWDLACDVAVENTINGLGLKAADDARARAQSAQIALLKGKVHMLTAEKLYRFFCDENYSEDQIAELREGFIADDHTPWYQRDHAEGNLRDEGTDADGDKPSDGGKPSSGDSEGRAAMARWAELSERVKMDMETFSRQQGDGAGNMTQNLAEVTRERYDYAAFLRKFAVLGEVMRVNDDEFDYVYYTYGLKLYGKMPLIEPLEYKEVKRVKEFVIAIDTSGSVSGELVQSFLNKTYNILQESESFLNKINVHIVQCDAEIQEDRSALKALTAQ